VHSLNDQAVGLAHEGKWQGALKLGLEALTLLTHMPASFAQAIPVPQPH
jgi:hypothetical protein